MVDFGGREGAACCDFVGVSASRGVAGLRFAPRYVEDVQLAACGGLDGVFDGWVMGDVMSIHDILDLVC